MLVDHHVIELEQAFVMASDLSSSSSSDVEMTDSGSEEVGSDLVPAPPGTWRDRRGWDRFHEPERQRRVDVIERAGQPAHVTVSLWQHLRPDQDANDDLWVLEFHPAPGFIHMSDNYRDGPWEELVPNGGYHMSLATLGEVAASPSLTRDLQDVIAHVDGKSGNIMIHRVDARTSTFINSWHCPILGGVWYQIRRLRQASTHSGPLTISA